MKDKIQFGQPMIWANLIMADDNDPHPLKGMFLPNGTVTMWGKHLITYNPDGSVRVDAVACQEDVKGVLFQNSDKTGHEGVLPRISQWGDTLKEAVTKLNEHCGVMNSKIDPDTVAKVTATAALDYIRG